MSRPWRSRWSVLLLLAVLALSCATEKRMPEDVATPSAPETVSVTTTEVGPYIHYRISTDPHVVLSVAMLEAMEVGDSLSTPNASLTRVSRISYRLVIDERYR